MEKNEINEKDLQGSTGDFTDYSTVVNFSGNASTQGLGAGSTYIYTIRTYGSGNEEQILIRTNKNSGASTNLTCGGSERVAFFKHANDVSVVSISGATRLFVTTLDQEVVEVIISGDTYYQNRLIIPAFDGSTINPAGIHVRNNTSSLTCFYKKGRSIYQADIAVNDTNMEQKINTSLVYTLQSYSDSKMNSSSFASGAFTWLAGSYDEQGFEINNGRLFVPLSGKGEKNANKSVVLVFNESSGQIDNSTTFRVNNAAYTTFEYEAVGIDSDGKIFISANVANKANAQYDGIFTFSAFTN